MLTGAHLCHIIRKGFAPIETPLFLHARRLSPGLSLSGGPVGAAFILLALLLLLLLFPRTSPEGLEASAGEEARRLSRQPQPQRQQPALLSVACYI